jgi:hypothetical protein
MRWALLLVAACAHPSGTGLQNDSPHLPGTAAPPASVWSAFAHEGAGWTLRGEDSTLTVLVTDVHEARDQHVAALTWTLTDKSGAIPTHTHFDEIVWGARGAWLAIAGGDLDHLLAGRPTVTEPPRVDKDPAHYVRWEDSSKGRVLCVGWEPGPDDGPCDDVCYGGACFAADGPVSIVGDWAPGDAMFEREGWKRR